MVDNEIQGICPEGWRIPTQADMSALLAQVSVEQLMASEDWLPQGGSNTVGFKLLPASIYNGTYNSFENYRITTMLLTAEPSGTMVYHPCKFGDMCGSWEFIPGRNNDGYSVRCVRDAEGAPAAMSVTTNSATNVTNNSAILHGTVPSLGDYSTAKVGFKYGTSSNALNTKVEKSENVGVGAYNCALVGLTANTTYFYKAFVASGSDTVYGNVQSFTTEFICGTDSIKDADNNWYHTVEMAGQCWMKENLKTTKINDMGAYYPATENIYVATYGRLYNWTAAMQGQTGEGVRGICPENWHIPTDDDWKNAEIAYLQFAEETDVDNLLYRGTGAGKFTDSNLWGTNGIGTCPNNNAYEYRNITNFTALPAGYYNGVLCENEVGAYFWTSTSRNDSFAYIRNIDRNHEGINRSNSGDKTYYYSVRCVRD